MRFPLGPGPYRDRLLDAMAWLLVDLHRAGVFWGDCSLANTLFRRDGDRIQAYPRRRRDERDPPVAVGRPARLRPRHPRRERGLRAGRPRRHAGPGRTPTTTPSKRPRPCGLATPPCGTSCHSRPELYADDRHAVRARIRRLNELGFAVDEISLEPTGACRATVRLRVAVASRRFHCARAPAADRVWSRSRARPGCCSTTCASTGTWLEFNGGIRSTEAAAPSAGWRTSSSRRSTTLRPGHRAWPRPDPGVLRRPRGEVAPVRGGRPRTSGSGPRSTRTSASARRRRRRDGSDPTLVAPRHRLVDGLGPTSESTATGPRRADASWRGRRDRSSPTMAGHARLDDGDPMTTRRTGHPRPRSGQALRRRPGGGRHRLRRGARRDLRAARPERRRQDDDRRDPGGPATARRRRGRACSGVDVATGADALKPRIGVSLQTAALYPKLTVVEVIDLFRSFYRDRRARPTS